MRTTIAAILQALSWRIDILDVSDASAARSSAGQYGFTSSRRCLVDRLLEQKQPTIFPVVTRIYDTGARYGTCGHVPSRTWTSCALTAFVVIESQLSLLLRSLPNIEHAYMVRVA